MADTLRLSDLEEKSSRGWSVRIGRAEFDRRILLQAPLELTKDFHHWFGDPRILDADTSTKNARDSSAQESSDHVASVPVLESSRYPLVHFFSAEVCANAAGGFSILLFYRRRKCSWLRIVVYLAMMHSGRDRFINTVPGSDLSYFARSCERITQNAALPCPSVVAQRRDQPTTGFRGSPSDLL